MISENDVSKEIVDAAYRLHRGLAPGLLESVYDTPLCGELQKRGLTVSSQHQIPVFYEVTRAEMGFRADLPEEDKVIVEIKSIADIAPIRKKQLQAYLRLANKRLGLLINFNAL